MKMKIYVAGSFTTSKGVKKVLELQNILGKAGFEVLNQLEAFDYTVVEDFRAEVELGKRIVENDLDLLEQVDVIVALADEPSFGIGAEVFYAKQILKKTIIAIVTKPAKSPWVISNANVILETYSVEELIQVLKDSFRNRRRELPS